MNIDTLAGEGTTTKGRIKESIGEVTGDPVLQQDGVADQMSGSVRKGFGALRDFARAQPLLTGAIAAIVGVGLLASRRRD